MIPGREILIPAAAAVGTVVVAPLAASAVGFGTVGIAAGSLAAKSMSLAATYGYGMTVVSALQSVGAVGLSTTQVLAVGGTVAAGVRKLLTWR